MVERPITTPAGRQAKSRDQEDGQAAQKHLSRPSTKVPTERARATSAGDFLSRNLTRRFPGCQAGSSAVDRAEPVTRDDVEHRRGSTRRPDRPSLRPVDTFLDERTASSIRRSRRFPGDTNPGAQAGEESSDDRPMSSEGRRGPVVDGRRPGLTDPAMLL
jgi:hypothetical protein